MEFLIDHRNYFERIFYFYFMSKFLRWVVAFLYFLSHECETGT